jgi:DNA helicase-2/ATP-dependent DNA helicase PcrA
MRLTLEQERAVAGLAAHKRIVAVAGSGKTRVLVEQVGRWVAAGAEPATTAVITFTRRAAEEIRRRIAREHEVEIGYGGTVHGMAYLALALALDGKHRLTPLTDEEVEAVVAHVAGESRLTSAVCPKVLKMARHEDVHQETMRPEQLGLAHMVQSYMDAARLVHVGHLVTRFVGLLLWHDDLRAWVQERARTVLWDEYQDATPEQAQLLDMLHPDRSCVVGDPAQAIFGFAGASDRYLLERTVETFTLSYNFRSAGLVVQAANRHLGRPALRAFREEPGFVAGWPVHDPSPISDDAMSGIGIALEVTGTPATVLCRTNREVAAVRDYLAAFSPAWRVCVASPGFDRYAGEPWKTLFLACRHVLDPACEWLASSVRRAGVTGTDLWDVKPRTTTAGEVLKILSPEAAAQETDDALGLSVLDFAGWYQRRDVEDLMPQDAGADVTVMTAHAAKGLEFERVVLAGVGHSLGRTGAGDDREEANLLYVGITRARDGLAVVGRPDCVAKLVKGGL